MLLGPIRGAAAAALVMSVPVAAQTIGAGSVGDAADTSGTPVQGVRVPTRVNQQRRADLNVGAVTTYDTNVARSSDALARQNGLSPEDVIFAPQVTADVYLPLGLSAVYLNGSADYSFYTKDTRLNGERLSLTGGGSHQLGVCRVALDGSINRARTIVTDLLVQGAGVQNFETATSIGVSGRCGQQVGLQPFAEFDYSRGTNTSEVRRFSDYRTLTYGGGLAYRQPQIGEFGLIGSIEDSTYTDRDGLAQSGYSPLQSFPTRSIGLYYVRDVTPFFTGKIRINYSNIDTGGVDNFSGVTGEVSVKVAPTTRFAVTVAGYRTVTPSLSFNADYEVQSGARVTADAHLTTRLDASAFYSYAHRSYVGGQPNLVIPLTSDEFNLVGAEAGYLVGRRIRLTLGTNYETRRANTAFFNYDSFRVLAGVRVAF